MYEIIQKWLNSSKDFDVGLEILKRYSNNQFLIVMLETGKDYWNEKQLIEALQKLGSSVQTIEKEEQFVKAKEIVKEVLKRPSDSQNAPKEVIELVAKRKKIYDEAKKLHARLELYPDEVQRFEAAKRILEIRAELKKMWSFTNFYDDNLRVPEVMKEETAKLEQLDDFTLNKMWHTHYKYINKFKSDNSKTDTIKERITLAYTIKEILIERHAFQYPNLSLPTLNG